MKTKIYSLAGHIKRLVCDGLVRRFLFKRGFVLIPVSDVEYLEAASLAYHVAQKKRDRDSHDRGYFNGLADQASKTAYTLKKYYPSNIAGQPRRSEA